MQETKNLKLKTFDFSTDSTPDFVTGVAGIDNNSNMEIIDDAISRKVMLDGEVSSTNFNLVQREVVQEGLIKVPQSSDNDFFAYVKGINILPNDAVIRNITSGYGYTVESASNSGFRLRYFDENGVTNNVTFLSRDLRDLTFSQNKTYEFYISKTGNVFSAYVNGILYTAEVTSIKERIGMLESSLSLGYVYNRALSPQEITHNLQVLSQSPSLDRLITTDENAQQKEFCFATDSNHVIMANGYNAEECASGLLATMGQEFVADETGEIVIENAVEKSKLLGVEIQGQTVKNIFPTESIKAIGDGSNYSISTIPRTLADQLKPSTPYTLVVEVLKNTLTDDFDVSHASLNSLPQCKIPHGETGVFTFNVVSKEVLDSNNAIRSAFSVAEPIGTEIYYKRMLLEGALGESIHEYLPFGLSSTEATLSINDNKYSFYEPTIEGKTEVIDGELVSLEASVEGLPSLGSVPSISDTIYRATKIMALNTKEELFNGSEEWELFSNLNTHVQFRVPKNVHSNSSPVCNMFPTKTYDSSTDEEAVMIGAGSCIHIKILKSKLATQDVAGFKQWLQSNPTTVRYQLAEPITRQLTIEEFNAYDHHKKVICLNQVGDVSDSLTQDKDGNIALNQSCVEIKVNTVHDIKQVITRENSTLIKIFSALSKWNTLLICSHYKYSTEVYSGALGVWQGGTGEIWLSVEKSLGIINNEDAFEYIKTNAIHFVAQLTTPTTTHIDHRASTTIPISNQQINICSASAVAPSELKVVAPTSDRVKKKYILTLQNGWTGELEAHLLQDKRVRIKGNIIAPDVHNALVCNLPEELKPIEMRSIFGVNDIIPIVTKVNTIPQLTITSEMIGEVEFDAEYEL